MDLIACVLPSPLQVRKRPHSSFCYVQPDRQSRAAGEASGCPCSLIASTLPSAVLAVLIAVLPDSTQTRFRGEHVPGTIPSRQFQLQYPGSEGVGKGKKRLWYVELSHAVLPGLGGQSMVPGYFTYQTFPVCLNPPSVQEQQQHFPALQKISAFLMCYRKGAILNIGQR